MQFISSVLFVINIQMIHVCMHFPFLGVEGWGGLMLYEIKTGHWKDRRPRSTIYFVFKVYVHISFSLQQHTSTLPLHRSFLLMLSTQPLHPHTLFSCIYFVDQFCWLVHTHHGMLFHLHSNVCSREWGHGRRWNLSRTGTRLWWKPRKRGKWTPNWRRLKIGWLSITTLT